MNIPYRADIDGLRAIAVSLVLIYHAKFLWDGGPVLNGGFLGVDVFFVISGFLITSIIRQEQASVEGFSLARFYERRIRRLVPPLLCVILASIPFAWIYLLPASLIDFSGSAVASIFFYSNFYWYFGLQEYGAESALLQPMLHTWSLAVEEQFYLFYPVILLFLIKRFPRHIVTTLVAGSLLSALLAIYTNTQNPSFAFYMFLCRFWELLAGCLCAEIKRKETLAEQPSRTSGFLSLFGLVIILASVFFADVNDNHPGIVTLAPVAGTMLIILCAQPGVLAYRILAFRPVVFVGLVSYSLYLWHYPVFAFARISDPAPTDVDKLQWIALSFVLATLTYYLVERPTRNRRMVGKRLLAGGLGGAAAVAVGANLVVVQFEGFSSRLLPVVGDVFRHEVLDLPYCHSRYEFRCHNKLNADRTFFLVGDSHMRALEGSMLEFANRQNANLIALNHSGCQYIPGLNRVKKKSAKIGECDVDLQEERRRVLLSNEKTIVVIGGRMPLILSEERFDNREGDFEGPMDDYMQNEANSLETRQQRKSAIYQHFKSGVLELARHGHIVVLIYPIPEVGFNVPQRILSLTQHLAEHEASRYLTGNPVSTSYDVYRDRADESFELYDRVVHENIVRIFPHRLFCNAAPLGRCLTHDSERIFYSDTNHLSHEGATILINAIVEKLDPYLAR